MKKSTSLLDEQIQNSLIKFAQCADNALSSILTSDDLCQFHQQCGGRNRLYPPVKTLSLFMQQVANENKSCCNVLIQEAMHQSMQGKTIRKTKNDAYCKARQSLPEHAVQSIFQASGQRMSEIHPNAWLWHNRRVVITDGTTISMPDTTANQKEYPQPNAQKKGQDVHY